MQLSTADAAQPPPALMKREAPLKLPEECQVCGTGANVRKNFGVPSCVSCRIFYSRNTGKQLICYQNGNCRIEGPSRKSCAACRFQKCMRAGMQKSRERKYKYRKAAALGAISKGPSSAAVVPQLPQLPLQLPQLQHLHHQQQQPQQPQQQQQPPQQPQQPQHHKTGSLRLETPPDSGHPPLDIFRDIGGLDTSVMDKSLFVHFYKMADMFRVPFDCVRDSLVVRDTFSGLNLLEAITKRTLAIIRFLPHFAQLDRTLVSAMVSEKISGLISILRTLHYQPATGAMTVRCSQSSAAPASENSPASSSSSSPAEVTLEQPLMHVINGLFLDLTTGDNPLVTDAEVGTVYLAATRLYCQCHLLFRDRLNIGVTLLLGMYFFLPDYKTVQVDEDAMRRHQSLYLRCLQDLLKVLSQDPSEAMDMYNRVLFLLTEVKSVDFYLSLLSRHVRFRSG